MRRDRFGYLCLLTFLCCPPKPSYYPTVCAHISSHLSLPPILFPPIATTFPRNVPAGLAYMYLRSTSSRTTSSTADLSDPVSLHDGNLCIDPDIADLTVHIGFKVHSKKEVSIRRLRNDTRCSRVCFGSCAWWKNYHHHLILPISSQRHREMSAP